MSTLLILKLLLVPALIAVITLAGRRWGAAVAGCLAGFPVVTGPILFFIAVEQGGPFAAHAAVAATIAVLSNIAFGLAYSRAAQRFGWIGSLLAGMAVYCVVVALLGLLHLSALQAAALTIAGLLLAARLYPPVSEEEAMSGPPKSDLPYRMVAGVLLVLAVTFFSSQLGPNLTGLFSVFPVMGSVLGVFSHRHYGRYFAVRLLRGMVRGFYAFTVFCLILAMTLEAQPIGICFLMALAAAIGVQSFLMYWQSRRFRIWHREMH